MKTISDKLCELDMFSSEPNLLTFGDPKKPHQRYLWRNVCGGICTVLFFIFMFIYLAISLRQHYLAMLNSIDDLESRFEPREMGPLTFYDMNAMPVVVMKREHQDSYVNASHPQFN